MRNKETNYRGKRNSKGKPKQLSGCITVHMDECDGNADKMVRRFIKKIKQEKILEEVRLRTHFRKPSDIKRAKKEETKRLIEKVNKHREELFKPKDRSFSRRKSY